MNRQIKITPAYQYFDILIHHDKPRTRSLFAVLAHDPLFSSISITHKKVANTLSIRRRVTIAFFLLSILFFHRKKVWLNLNPYVLESCEQCNAKWPITPSKVPKIVFFGPTRTVVVVVDAIVLYSDFFLDGEWTVYENIFLSLSILLVALVLTPRG